MNSPRVERISECFIKPQSLPEEWNQPYHLSPWDLLMLSANYIQKGLLFAKPTNADSDTQFMETLLDRLKHSLSLALVHFYPLAGRLKTTKSQNPPSSVIYVDCADSPGARFIHATLHMTASEILSPTYVPTDVVHSLFDHHKAVNHDGHVTSLFSVQATELLDSVFIGCSMNHSLGDGTSYWSFFKSWSEIFRTDATSSRPILKRWIPDGHGPIFALPFDRPEEFISRFEAPELRERIFHFSAESVAKLKAKANSESGSGEKIISSLQSLAALVWRCVTRARDLPRDQTSSCLLAANNRPRLDPPISEDYFGNSIHALKATAAAGDLLDHDLGWAAWKMHQAVVSHDDKVVRELLEAWIRSPIVVQAGRFLDPFSVLMGSSPRFNKYGSEFGMGRALALRSGYANKFSGKVSCYPGREGGGSIDLEICLPPETMLGLESDPEFIGASG